MQGVIKIDDPKYPNLLKEISDPPKQLYYKGEWQDEIFENCLAVVGSRRMTTYGRQIAEKLVSEIASRGITIVSGFMYGIDATAHKAAVDIGAKTIAVMPCGIELVHPENQVKLYDEILENNGLIISEYDGNLLPTNWTYPRRNRIVAGLSKAIMVVEAGERSGSLITANFAKKFKRKIFAVPGPLTSILSKGINQLIREGAGVVTCAEDVLEFFGRSLKEVRPFGNSNEEADRGHLPASRHGVSMNSLEQQIIQQLQKEPMEIDLLSRFLGVSAAEAGKVLSMMELRGLVFVENGKYYIKN
ncbi:MAG: DNA-processing protein DprA [bacterium]|nr:DNA-processing protein DprA [bacterium]